MYTYPASIIGFMYRKKSVRRRVVMCWPSTSASAMVTILWYRTFSSTNSGCTPAPIAVISARISSFFSIWSSRAFSTFRIFPFSGRIAWNSRFRPFHDKNFRLRGTPLRAAREPPREVEPLEEPLAAGELPRLPRGLSRLCREDRLLEDRACGLRGLVEELRELLVHPGVHDPLHLGVPQFHLRLPLELGLGDLDRKDRCEALAAVVAIEALPALHVLVPLCVVVQRAGERGLEPDEMCAALDRVDVVHKRVDRLRVPVVPLERGLDLHAVDLLRQVDRRVVEWRLPAVDPLHVLGDASLELEDISAAVDRIRDHDSEALVQEREFAKPRRERLEVELRCFEDLSVGFERNDGSRAVRRSDRLEVLDLLATLKANLPFLAVAADPRLEPLAEPVDDAQADAVKATAHAVQLVLELPTRVHPRHHEFRGGQAVLRVDLDGDSASIVRDRHGAVAVDRDLDVLAESHHRFVDRIVHDLVDEVVQPPFVEAADIHRGALSDGLKALQNLDRFRVVRDRFRASLFHLFHTNFETDFGIGFSPLRTPSRSPGSIRNCG